MGPNSQPRDKFGVQVWGQIHFPAPGIPQIRHPPPGNGSDPQTLKRLYPSPNTFKFLSPRRGHDLNFQPSSPLLNPRKWGLAFCADFGIRASIQKNPQKALKKDCFLGVAWHYSP